MQDEKLKLPFALNNKGQFVTVKNANKIDGPFMCPECNDKVHLKKAEIRKPHFAHNPKKKETDCKGGYGQTYQHKFAKSLIMQNFYKWIFIDKCSHCPKILETITMSKNSIAEEEKSVKCKSGKLYIPDIRVSIDNKVTYAIEILHSHKVSVEKDRELYENNIIVIEISAAEVINKFENDVFKVATVHKKFCDDCEITQKEVFRQIQKLQSKTTEDHNELKKWELKFSKYFECPKPKMRINRPCYQCTNWFENSELKVIQEMPYHDYPQAFACKDCIIKCPDCNCSTTTNQIETYKRCWPCNQEKLVKCPRCKKLAPEDKIEEYGQCWACSNKKILNKSVKSPASPDSPKATPMLLDSEIYEIM